MSTTSKKSLDPGGEVTQFECRTCLKIMSKSKSSCSGLFRKWSSPWDPKLMSTIAQDLEKLVYIQISESDEYSKLICQGCCTKLYSACRFISAVKQSEQVLKERSEKDNYEIPIKFVDQPWPKPIQVNKNVNSDIEIKQEVLSDDESQDSLRPDFAMDPEPEEQTSHIKITVNGTISLADMGKHSSIITNGSEIYEDVEFLDAVKEEPLSEDDDLMNLDLPLECMLCTKNFKCLSGLKAHVISHHSYKSVRRKSTSEPSPEKKQRERHVCTTCKRNFTTRTDLMVHETCHNKCACFGCDGKFDTFDQLTRHRKRCKTIINNNKDVIKPKMLEDVIRPFPEISIDSILEKSNEEDVTENMMKCSLCPETFSETYYMKIHHEIHHSNEQPNEETKKVEETDNLTSDAETKALQNMFEATCKTEIVYNDEENSTENKQEIQETSQPVEIHIETNIKMDVIGDKYINKMDVDDDNIKEEQQNLDASEHVKAKFEIVNGVKNEGIVVKDEEDEVSSMETITPLVFEKMDIENAAIIN